MLSNFFKQRRKQHKANKADKADKANSNSIADQSKEAVL
jgi:hypothetical protein